MTKRWHIINSLIKSNDYKHYLEIGVGSWENFTRVRCPCKYACDPDPKLPENTFLYNETSDSFFSKHPSRILTGLPLKFDIIFIDGLHQSEQVERDIVNGLNALSPTGVLVLHDCNPPTKDSQVVPRGNRNIWCGDVWRAFVGFKQHHFHFESYCYDTDYGVGIIWNNAKLKARTGFSEYMIDYEYLNRNRQELLDLRTVNIL